MGDELTVAGKKRMINMEESSRTARKYARGRLSGGKQAVCSRTAGAASADLSTPLPCL